MRCFWRCRAVSALAHATHVRVHPAPHRGKGELVPLERRANNVLRFEYQKRPFTFDADAGSFTALPLALFCAFSFVVRSKFLLICFLLLSPHSLACLLPSPGVFRKPRYPMRETIGFYTSARGVQDKPTFDTLLQR